MLSEVLSPEDPTELFEFLEEIASGAFGAVYKAVHLATGEPAAVKICELKDEEDQADLILEISILKRCSHANVVKFFGAYKKENELFIAMELCQGSVNTLFEVLEEGIPEKLIAYITRESLKGLAYLHSVGIIHRDIKAPNILMTVDGGIKLADFGVSAILGSPDEKRTSFVGTPWWMAPEIVLGARGEEYAYDNRVDIWAVGCTCLEMAEAKPPRAEFEPMEVIYEIISNDPPELTDPTKWSEEFIHFIKCCLDKDMAERRSAEEMLDHVFVSDCEASATDLATLIQKVYNKSDEYQKEHEMDSSAETETTEDDDDKELRRSVRTFKTRTATVKTTYRPKTLREQQNYEAKLLAERLMAQQVRVLKRLQKQQQKAVKEMEKKHTLEIEKVVTKNSKNLKKTIKEDETALAKLKKEQTSELDALLRQQESEMKSVTKKQSEEMKDAMDKLEASTKEAKAIFKDKLKAEKKEDEKEMKKLKGVAAKEMKKTFELEMKEKKLMKELRFNHEQQLVKMNTMQKHQLGHMLAAHKATFQQIQDRFAKMRAQLDSYHEAAHNCLLQTNAIELDSITVRRDLKLNALEEVSRAETVHLAKHQTTEADLNTKHHELQSKQIAKDHERKSKLKKKEMKKRIAEEMAVKKEFLDKSKLKQTEKMLTDKVIVEMNLEDVQLNNSMSASRVYKFFGFQQRQTEDRYRQQENQISRKHKLEREFLPEIHEMKMNHLAKRGQLLGTQLSELDTWIVQKHVEERKALDEIQDLVRKLLQSQVENFARLAEAFEKEKLTICTSGGKAENSEMALFDREGEEARIRTNMGKWEEEFERQVIELEQRQRGELENLEIEKRKKMEPLAELEGTMRKDLFREKVDMVRRQSKEKMKNLQEMERELKGIIQKRYDDMTALAIKHHAEEDKLVNMIKSFADAASELLERIRREHEHHIKNIEGRYATDMNNLNKRVNNKRDEILDRESRELTLLEEIEGKKRPGATIGHRREGSTGTVSSMSSTGTIGSSGSPQVQHRGTVGSTPVPKGVKDWKTTSEAPGSSSSPRSLRRVASAFDNSAALRNSLSNSSQSQSSLHHHEHYGTAYGSSGGGGGDPRARTNTIQVISPRSQMLRSASSYGSIISSPSPTTSATSVADKYNSSRYGSSGGSISNQMGMNPRVSVSRATGDGGDGSGGSGGMGSRGNRKSMPISSAAMVARASGISQYNSIGTGATGGPPESSALAMRNKRMSALESRTEYQEDNQSSSSSSSSTGGSGVSGRSSRLGRTTSAMNTGSVRKQEADGEDGGEGRSSSATGTPTTTRSKFNEMLQRRTIK